MITIEQNHPLCTKIGGTFHILNDLTILSCYDRFLLCCALLPMTLNIGMCGCNLMWPALLRNTRPMYKTLRVGGDVWPHCVHRKALLSPCACGRSGSARSKRNVWTRVPLILKHRGLSLVLHNVGDSLLLQVAWSAEKIGMLTFLVCLWAGELWITVENIKPTSILLLLSGTFQ